MDKAAELKKAKTLALAFLLVATLVFVVTIFLPRSVGVDCIKAISEAAMVGALADWFAVVALFRRVPLPFIAAHTAIIPNNKERIANNLAVFIEEKFLDVQSIVELIRKHDPAHKISDWLSSPENADGLGRYIVKLSMGLLGFVDDARIQKFIGNALHACIDKLDFSKSAGDILDSLTRDGRHQALLDAAIGKLIKLMSQPGTSEFIAAKVVGWLKREHRIKEKVLPSEWIGENSAAMFTSALNSLLAEVGSDPEHQLRRNFDLAVQQLVARLKTDPGFLQQGEAIKAYLQTDEKFNTYIKDIWTSLLAWLQRDLGSSDSVLHGKVVATGRWLGRELAQDPQLRASLNQHMEQAARGMAPDFARFLSKHISDTVSNWDARDMSRLIELNIGKDLQFIRINGTIVGGLIGALLFLISHLPEVAGLFRH